MTIAIRKILCPVDFSANAEHALRYAVALAQSHGAELVLLHVMEMPDYALPEGTLAVGVTTLDLVRELEEGCRQQLEALAESARADVAQVTTQFVTGAPFVEIVRAARDQEADLIVMGTHGRSGLAHMMIGSVAEKVVRKAPCPVLTVKHPEHEFVMP